MTRHKEFKALFVSKETHELVKRTAFEGKYRSMDEFVGMLVKNYRIVIQNGRIDNNPMSSGGYEGGMR